MKKNNRTINNTTNIVINNNNNINNNNSNNNNVNSNDEEARQDIIFRKVRGILNKITPETFDKLSKDLINVGLDSPRTLRGVIYLLFDKALKDLKYSSLYAKLCQELSEKAPNFEQDLTGPNTFCKFLISKCEDEFERRRKATEDFDNKLGDLTDEEYEQKAIAKQKMLGNIKFICELGKKRLLQEEILHECIRGLLSKKKERAIQDQAQDLECLCQIMKTIGSLLDIQASKNLMNQYFERIDLFSKKPELPSRIRFMLRDVIDLRNNKWRLRPFQREDNAPQTLSKLREEAGYDPSVSTAATGSGSSVDKFGNNRKHPGINDLSKFPKSKLSQLLDDEPSFTTSTDIHWGPSAYLSFDDPFGDFPSNTSKIKRDDNTSKNKIPVKNLPSQPISRFDENSIFRNNSLAPNYYKPPPHISQPSQAAPKKDPMNIDQLITMGSKQPSSSNQGNNIESHKIEEKIEEKKVYNQPPGMASDKAPVPESSNYHPNRRTPPPHYHSNLGPAQQSNFNQVKRPFNRNMPSTEPFPNRREPRGRFPPTHNPHQPRFNDTPTDYGPRGLYNRFNNQTIHPSHKSHLSEPDRNTNWRRGLIHDQNSDALNQRDQPESSGPGVLRRPPMRSHEVSPPLGTTNRSPNRLENSDSMAPKLTELSQSSNCNYNEVRHSDTRNMYHASSGPPLERRLPHSTIEPPNYSVPLHTQPPHPSHNSIQQPIFNHNNRQFNRNPPPFDHVAGRREQRGRFNPNQINPHDVHYSEYPTKRYPREPRYSNDVQNNQPDYPPRNFPPRYNHQSQTSHISHFAEPERAPNWRRNPNTKVDGGSVAQEHRPEFENPPPFVRPINIQHDANLPQRALPNVMGRGQENIGPVVLKKSESAIRMNNNNIDSRLVDPRKNVFVQKQPLDERIIFNESQNHPVRPNPPPQTLNNELLQQTNFHHPNRPFNRNPLPSENYPSRRENRSRNVQHLIGQDRPSSQETRRFQNDSRNDDIKIPDSHDANIRGSMNRADHPNVQAPPTSILPPEQEKFSNWRRTTSSTTNTTNNNVSTSSNIPVKEQNPNTQKAPLLFTKPPGRVNDGNFSLRPSHNLTGRNIGSVRTQPSPPSNDKQENLQHIDPSTRFDRPTNDLTKLRNNPSAPQGTNQVSSSTGGDHLEKESNGPISNPVKKSSDIPSKSVLEFNSILVDLFKPGSTWNFGQIASKVKDLKIPKDCQHDCLASAMKISISKTDTDREIIGKLFAHVIPTIFDSTTLLEAFKDIFEQMHALEVETPKMKSLVAGFLSQAVLDGLISLEQVGEVLRGGKHHPLFLLVLQKLEKSAGQAWLNDKYIASKVVLMDMLPEVDQSKDRLASILKDRCLGFLDPMLTIGPDLWQHMTEKDSSPAGIYRWVKDNIDSNIQMTPTFAYVLISCLIKYIHQAASGADNKSKNTANNEQKEDPESNKSTPTQSTSSQCSNEAEKELVTRYQQVLQALIKDKQMQLATLYALQTFYYNLDFPKGSLLRWFDMLYDLNIVDDDVYFTWKEEINDVYPGKGQALFQVNTWLNWLAEAESEEEEEEVAG